MIQVNVCIRLDSHHSLYSHQTEVEHLHYATIPKVSVVAEEMTILALKVAESILLVYVYVL